MSGRFIDFLLTRPAREQILLGVLILIVLPLALIVGVLLPLREDQTAAMAAREEARALQGWVVDRAREAATLPRTGQGAGTPPISSSGVEQSLINANLRGAVSGLSERDTGVIELTFDEVTFTRLANWLSESAPIWGYDIEAFRFEDIDVPGKVSASLTLTPSG